MYVPTGAVHRAQINQAAAQVERELAPRVRYIRYTVGPDWSGQWAVFLKVILADEVSTGNALRDITTQVVWRMSELLNLPHLGLFPYFDFRSESEQAALNEPGWRAAG
jgi:hypothetical protein